ncbi:hypothetical protein [Pseudomonas sp. GL-RE-20]|uniref:hypothetical protein n=1 Tax=Pseudomonas sp. GL-RE-20 TaxID=2832372 RepID=UPI001CBF29FB|nr:hypothetical protein [Pseudomonas sp. GL-RE-20]
MDYVPTPYEQLGGALVAPRNSGIKRWEDLKDKTVCISQGASFQQPLTRDYHVKLKALRKQQPEMRQVLDRVVQDWHGSGWILELGRQYRMQPSPLIIGLHDRYKTNPSLKTPVVPQDR